MEIKTKSVYISDDGMEFDDEISCTQHERLCNVVEKRKYALYRIKAYDSYGNDISRSLNSLYECQVFIVSNRDTLEALQIAYPQEKDINELGIYFYGLDRETISTTSNMSCHYHRINGDNYSWMYRVFETAKRIASGPVERKK